MDPGRPADESDDAALVSVVIPAYNAEGYVAEAIESVLAQTHPAVECIVVDDGSTDATAAAVARFGGAVKALTQANMGVAAARNHGAREARGPLLAFLDADDVWLPHKLARQIEALQAQPEAGVVLCAMRVTDAGLHPTGESRLDPGSDLLERLILLDGLEMVGVSQAALIRQECFKALGGFDTRFGTSADWQFLLRLLRRWSWAYVDEPLVLYRVHGANMSRNVAATEHDLLLGLGELFSETTLEPRLAALRHPAYGNVHRLLAGSYFVVGCRRDFLRHAFTSLRHDPSELAYYLRWPTRRLRRAQGPTSARSEA